MKEKLRRIVDRIIEEINAAVVHNWEYSGFRVYLDELRLTPKHFKISFRFDYDLDSLVDDWAELYIRFEGVSGWAMSHIEDMISDIFVEFLYMGKLNFEWYEDSILDVSGRLDGFRD